MECSKKEAPESCDICPLNRGFDAGNLGNRHPCGQFMCEFSCELCRWRNKIPPCEEEQQGDE